MTVRSRLLGDLKSPTKADNAGDSDFVVILAALLCALICVLGLTVVARCTWFRRISGVTIGRSPSPAANKGLKKKVLDALPKQTYTTEDAGKLSDCAICLAEFVAGDEIRVLPLCAHGFHLTCIDTWLGSHSSCPTCRQLLVPVRCQKCGERPTSSGASGAGRLDIRPTLSYDLPGFLP